MIRLIPIESGFLRTDASVLCDGAKGPVRVPVCCWVVVHPRGTLIFDTGLHSDLQQDPVRLGGLARIFGIEMQHDLGAALEQQQVDATSIDYIVFSHLHWDHSGGTRAIPNATILVQQDEWAFGQTEEFVSNTAFAASDFDLGHPVTEVRGHHDIFGDGSVVCVPTPGHTPGHQSLRVELDSGSVLLTGDCCYWQHMLDKDLVPPFGFDIPQQRASMALLRKLQGEGVRLIFGHDADQWQTLGGVELT